LSDSAERIARRLKLPHLRLTLALANTGQISAAARALNMSQPAASRMLAEMERLLGAPVCVRGPKGVELSETGLALAERARRILTELSEAGRDVVEISAGKAGTVYIGAVTAPAIDLVVPALQRLKSAHPTIEASAACPATWTSPPSTSARCSRRWSACWCGPNIRWRAKADCRWLPWSTTSG
jgi:DNA-binding transcriptional LysR family regulator